MDELLKKLLEAEVLSESTKTELESALKKQLDEATISARAEATALVTAELNEQWITERETLIEALDAKVSEVLESEIVELKTDIERFRDLEAEYAEKIVEAKAEMATNLKSDLSSLVENLDSFLELRLAAEMEELKEDIALVKKNEFGRGVFEAFVAEFKKHYTEDNSVEQKLSETEQQLDKTVTVLEHAERKIAKMEREQKLQSVLTPITGRTREVMEAILKNVDTPLLEEAYQTYIGRVVRETVEAKPSEKETKVLAEGKKTHATGVGVVKNGNNNEIIAEHAVIDTADANSVKHISAISADERARIQRLAGISR